MKKYRKTIAAAITGWIGWGFVVVNSVPVPITGSEWLALAVVTATALGVYIVPNEQPEPIIQTIYVPAESGVEANVVAPPPQAAPVTVDAQGFEHPA